VGLVATDAATHCSYARVLSRRIDLRNITVTHDALHAPLQMRSVRPRNTRGHLINAYPRNRLVQLGEFGELYDCRAILDHGHVAGHAGARSRESHLIAGIRIGVAVLAFQSLRDVRLMAEWKRLGRSGMRRKILSYLQLRRLRRLLRSRCEASQKHNRKSDKPTGDCSFAYHRPTSLAAGMLPAMSGIPSVSLVNLFHAGS
jgi:hypothetical protein